MKWIEAAGTVAAIILWTLVMVWITMWINDRLQRPQAEIISNQSATPTPSPR